MRSAGLDDEASRRCWAARKTTGSLLNCRPASGCNCCSLAKPPPPKPSFTDCRLLPPLEPRALLILAQIHERMNRIEKAGKLARAREIRSAHAGPGSQCEVVRSDGCCNARTCMRKPPKLLRAELSRTRESPLRHHDLFALAKSLDALGRFDESFAALDEAHRRQLANMRARGATLLVPAFTADAAGATRRRSCRCRSLGGSIRRPTPSTVQYSSWARRTRERS